MSPRANRATLVPATKRRKPNGKFLMGVDGCRAGWVVVQRNIVNGETTVDIIPNFRKIVNGVGKSAAMVMVDMPIGLCDHGRRACETLARQLLKPLRHSSVFSSPRRPMLAFDCYEDANRFGKSQGPDGGGGLSKQAWMITPKIREIDEIMSPALQDRIAEAHPEIAFYRLNKNSPCLHSKRKKEGLEERKAVLIGSGIVNPDMLFEHARTIAGSEVSRDDVYDACALALTAKARLENSAVHLTDDALDARGLKMEIWG